jgi:hypothetical protein
MKWTTLAFIAFSTVWGFGNVLNGFIYFNGIQVIFSWILIKVTIRRNLDHEKDFADIWWVGDRADGGMAAICLKNALSTGGFSLQTTKNGKGQIACELTGHVSINAQDTMPMEFYVSAATA